MKKVPTPETIPASCKLSFDLPQEDTLQIHLAGRWRIDPGVPSPAEVQKQLESDPRIQRITFAAKDITEWDSALLTFLIAVQDQIAVINQCSQGMIRLEMEGLPKGVKRLLDLAASVPEKQDAKRESLKKPFLAAVGIRAYERLDSAKDTLAFIGEAFLALFSFVTGRARFRRRDLFLFIQECGPQALPIVTLISMLVGLILAFIGAVQLKMFGAQIFVANLVGISMVRQMGAIMTGIIMAGRTGASFAAQLGTMQVNEEIDALKTMGISPMEFLVLPRMLALTLMMPLLCLYADLMGVLGGFIVGVAMLDLNMMEYYNQTREAVGLNDLGIGLFMGVVFGVLVALAGCLRGMQCGRSASAVGSATTSAVVTAIVSIIVATAIITVVCDVIGI